MRDFDELVAEAETADVSGWGFGWLDGRATEQRPPWGYARLLAGRLATVTAALDIDTGGGEVLDEAPRLPPVMVATEGWAPNLERARARLEPRGVQVVEAGPDATLPMPEQSFDLVTSRHPVRPRWSEIHRLLRPAGTYFAQHVGPESAFELIERFVRPAPEARRGRHPDDEVLAATRVGLEVIDLQTTSCRLEFFDVGAIVWTLRKCVWWVPDFSVRRYETQLRELDRHIREHGSFLAHSTRHLIEARRLIP